MDGNSINGDRVFLRTAINSDFESILNIDLKSFDPSWEPKKFEAHRETTRVLIIKDRVVGFWVATLETEEHINLLRLAVTPAFRRIGVGTVLME
ncbi:MAG: GNAT family N-acetyltransferase, partial [Thaumarchaeota archaeon]|nr:GNAT family N-acetyltransferase [Nitrososphaerota archaeon]